MAQKKKKVEFLQVALELFDSAPKSLDFISILKDKIFKNNEVYLKGKNYELKLIEETDDYLIGIIETANRNGIPPKKNKKSKTVSKIGLTNEEGLAYANVFLYQKKTQVLLYEVNKFGCFIDNMISFIYLVWKEKEEGNQFKLRFNLVLNKDEYKRIIDLSFHKSLEIRLANPTQLLKEDLHKNKSLISLCQVAEEVNSKEVFAKFDVKARKNKVPPLNSEKIGGIVNALQDILLTVNAENVKKVIVKGYAEDQDQETTIDLIADRMIKFMKLEEPRESSDLLISQRKEEIRKIYEETKNELSTIFISHE
ncbi:hypothetical protein MODO_0786 [Myroides odoratimimus]|uniref:DUF6731 family protein n=1 Tax=Myroides odoratimimus TaxID=76832 RepID=UPI00072654CD|nr:DUF6731 family protein [Myroides odoratimimus]GAQ13139.1 hypothetical protein MODO_0786 [Myroides odoratimimus]STZ48388.1 Uncharacterised protein [Myroides odoratimimus]